jgi:hypothetical protein
MVRWWWTGTDVEKEELLREVRELDEAGCLGGEIQAFMIGVPGNLSKKDPARYERLHRFMEPYYYEMVKAVLDEAAVRGMTFDLTVGSAWPAGGVHVSKEDSLKMLLMGSKVVKGGRPYKGPAPRFRKPIFYRILELANRIIDLPMKAKFYRQDMKLVKVTAARPIGKPGRVRSMRPKMAYIDVESVIDLTDRVRADGVLEWDVPGGKWQIFAFYAGPAGTMPVADSRQDPERESLVVDHLKRGPIEKHLERHLGRAREYFGGHFGSTLRAFFTDSLELASEWMWTDGFLDEFKSRRGYDLSPYLPVNYVPGRDNTYARMLFKAQKPCFDFPDGMGERIRHDYEQTVSDLFAERFVQAMTDWANANGLKSRIQAYGIRADTLKVYGISHIPETEQLYAGGMMDFLRLAGSAGLIYDKPIVTAESLVWNTRDYLTTPLKWKVAADRLFVSGVNRMIYHAFPYQHPDYPYPGYNPWSSPYAGMEQMCFSANFSRTNTFWEYFPKMNGYITRCQWALQQGKTVCNVGLYYPLFNYPHNPLKGEEMVGGYLDEFDAPLPKRAFGGRVPKKLSAEEKWLQMMIGAADNLLEHGYNYTHVNPESLLSARIQNGKIVIGAARLEAIVMSRVEKVTVEVARKLKEIADSGIPVIFIGQVPDRQPGFFNYKESDAIVARVMGDMKEKHKDVIGAHDSLADHLGRRGVKPGVSFEVPQPTIHYIHKSGDGMDYYFLRHSKREPISISVSFPHPNYVPYLLDPWTGEAKEAAQYEVRDGSIRMSIAFPPFGSTIIAFRPSQPSLHVTASDLSVLREDRGIIAYADTAGEYKFALGDGSKRAFQVGSDIPGRIELDRWHLKTELRDHHGVTRVFELELNDLKDWREIPELKYCSSKGVYTARVNLDSSYLQPDLRLILDLGRVQDAAVVQVNGQTLDPLLVFPYAADVTSYLRAGENQITVTATPTLRNRLIGYGKSGGKNWRRFKKRKEFAPSGLIGPVRLIPEQRIVVAMD